MIESREQRRKRSTLLHRRKVAIVASILLVAILSGTLAFVFTYFKNVIPYKEIDTNTKEEYQYYIKKIAGLYKMYDDEGKLLSQQTPPGTSDPLYVTELGTMIYVNEETGEYERRVVPEMLFSEEDLEREAYLSIFKSIKNDIPVDANRNPIYYTGPNTEDYIVSIDIHNSYGDFTVCRLHIDEKTGKITLGGNKGDYVLRNASLSAINKDYMSYLTFYSGFPLVQKRLEDPVKDANGEYSEYGLVAEKRIDKDGKEYDYTPSYYVITSASGLKHKVIIGDALLDKSGYYIQYEDKNGVKRDAVYILKPTDMTEVNGTTFENTILGPAKNLLTPSLIYPATGNDYHDVNDFSINKKENGELDEIVNFSYVDIADRTQTVLGIHPYVFSDDSFKGYHPNYDNIDLALQKLMDPDIVDIAVVAPTKEQRVEYGIMKKIDKGDGTFEYVYDSEYVIKFKKKIKPADSEESFELVQTIYVSKRNSDGNYYTFTEMRAPNITDENIFNGVKIDMICEVSTATLDFLEYDTYDWIYPQFMQIQLDYVKDVEFAFGDNNTKISVNNYEVGKNAVIDVIAVDGKKYTDASPLKTFGILNITESNGNVWVVTPQEVKVYNAAGTELKPETRTRVENSIGQKVQILQKPIAAANGDWYYINKDDITIAKKGGGSETILRHHTMLFQRMFATINGTRIIDSYRLTDEEEAALRADKSAHIMTIKITDTEGEQKTYEFYSLPGSSRKAYIFVDGVGGFYVQATRLTKIMNDVQRFMAGEPVYTDDIK